MRYALIVLFALGMISSLFEKAFATDRLVPSLFQHIGDALAISVPGQDRVVVANQDAFNTPYAEAVTMVSNVPVIAAEGESPIIDAGNLATAAVTWPATANSNTRLEGFTVRGGTQRVLYVRDQGVVQDCIIDNEGTSGLTKGIESNGGTIIDACTVTMSGSQVNYGIIQVGSSTIIDCDITVAGSTNSQGIGSE